MRPRSSILVSRDGRMKFGYFPNQIFLFELINRSSNHTNRNYFIFFLFGQLIFNHIKCKCFESRHVVQFRRYNECAHSRICLCIVDDASVCGFFFNLNNHRMTQHTKKINSLLLYELYAYVHAM